MKSSAKKQQPLRRPAVSQSDASRGDILRHGMLLAALGLLGVGGATGLTQLLGNLIYGIGSRDPVTLAIVAAVLGFVALLACLILARKATQVNPVIALRAE